MTIEGLHKILDNADYKLSLKELNQVIYELKQDCTERWWKEKKAFEQSYYNGEQNAFQIALDLLEHLEVKE